MKIKDQIRIRREALGMSMKELADRVDVTEQAVRHWENGRSFPGKSKMQLVERALSFNIDWTEGSGANQKTAVAMVDPRDMELLVTLARLPLRAKQLFAELAIIHAEAVDKARGVEAQQAPPAPPAKTPTKRAAKAH